MSSGPIYTILLVDDDPVVRRDVGRALGGRGMDVRLAADGAEALQAAREEQFDLILLDVRMPGRGSDEVLKALRAEPHTARTRVYLLCEDGDADLVAAAAREDVTGVLRKDEMGADGVATEIATFLTVEATQEPPRKLRPRRVASVPAAVDEIAKRFRPADGTEATAESVRRARARMRTRPPRPRDAVDTYRQNEQLRARPVQEARQLGNRRFVSRSSSNGRVASEPLSQPISADVSIVSRADVEQNEYDTLLNRFAGDAVKLIEQLGVPVDLVCTQCRSRLVLRLTPDEDVRAGVRGRFVCGSCGRL
jgi:CheY-like chemotaxis protein